jgi:hypothetical protein
MNSAFEDFVYVGLVGLRFLSGEATKFVKDLRSDADGDQMFGVAGDRTTNAAGARGLFVGGFRNIGKVQMAIRQRLMRAEAWDT